MTLQVNIGLPEIVFSALRKTPEAFVKEMRVAAAVKWYEMRVPSEGDGNRRFEPA